MDIGSKRCTIESALEKVVEMYGEATDDDGIQYQKAYTSTEGNHRMARKVFNQSKTTSNALLAENRALLKVIGIFAENTKPINTSALSNVVSGSSSYTQPNDEHKETMAHYEEVGNAPITDPQGEPQVQTEAKQHPANDMSHQDPDDDVPLPTARYKKQKVFKNLKQETLENSTYPWISEYGLQAACYNSFFGNVPANVHVSAKRDYNDGKGITVFFSEGRRDEKVVHGYIHPRVLERQECKGMQKLTEFFRVGSTIAREKGGDAPNISAEEIFKRINRSSE